LVDLGKQNVMNFLFMLWLASHFFGDYPGLFIGFVIILSIAE